MQLDSPSPFPQMAGVYDGRREAADDEDVMSEVHLGCPPRFSGYYVSRFTFSIPQAAKTENIVLGEHHAKEASTAELLPLDDDGDLLLTRRTEGKGLFNLGLTKEMEKDDMNPSPRRVTRSRTKKLLKGLGVRILNLNECQQVQQEVWKAALLLADFILHESFTSSDFSDVVALELGAGTGIVGFILAHVAKMVFLTGPADEEED